MSAAKCNFSAGASPRAPRAPGPVPASFASPSPAWTTLAVLLLLLTGCHLSPPVRGLRPIYPKVSYRAVGGGMFSSQKPETQFVELNSCQPTLKWESFPTAKDKKADAGHVLENIEQVGYDLKIWRVENGAPAELVYEREGLPQPEHKLEKALAPWTYYCWSMRARFKLHGERRLGEWSFSQWPWPPDYYREYGATPRRTDHIPPANYYRFRTP